MNLYDNTIIIFSSDNGGVIPEDKTEEEESQTIKYGLKINGDLRGRRHTFWEEGTNDPFIVIWPGKVVQHTVSNDLVILKDIFVTVADTTGNGLQNDKKCGTSQFQFSSFMNKKE